MLGKDGRPGHGGTGDVFLACLPEAKKCTGEIAAATLHDNGLVRLGTKPWCVRSTSELRKASAASRVVL